MASLLKTTDEQSGDMRYYVNGRRVHRDRYHDVAARGQHSMFTLKVGKRWHHRSTAR